jgi:hypothetical protein
LGNRFILAGDAADFPHQGSCPGFVCRVGQWRFGHEGNQEGGSERFHA